VFAALSEAILILLFALLALVGLGWLLTLGKRQRTIKKRLAEGWNSEDSLIKPLEEKGVPAQITRTFISFFEDEDFYPFLPDEYLYYGTEWEEQQIEAALIKLAELCNKRLPETNKEREEIVYGIYSVSDFLKALSSLPEN
jgi:hypothetical protein